MAPCRLAAEVDDVVPREGLWGGGWGGEDPREGVGVGGVGLHEVGLGAAGCVLGCQLGELRQDFVDDAVVRGELVAVDVVGEVAADEAWDWDRMLARAFLSEGVWGVGMERSVPKPPMMRMDGFVLVPLTVSVAGLAIEEEERCYGNDSGGEGARNSEPFVCVVRWRWEQMRGVDVFRPGCGL